MKFRLPEGKDLVLVAAAAAVAALALLASVSFHTGAKAELSSLQTQRAEFQALKNELTGLRASVGGLEEKGSLSEVQGVVQAIGEIFSQAGLKGKLKSVTPLGTRNVLGATAEEAELKADRVSIDETVSLLYRMQNAPMGLVIRKASLRRSFEEPELLDLTMTVSLLLRNK